MKINDLGLQIIKDFEGCRLKAYKALKSEKYYTIGWGHYGVTDPNMTITQAEADTLLLKDLEKFEAHVNKYNEIYHFNVNQFSSLVSFAYNIGNIDQLTNNGKRSINEIADAIPRYNIAGGNVLQGLVRRRAREVELFASPINSTASFVKYSENTTLGQLVDDIIKGHFGNGDLRKNNIYKTIQNLVNDRLSK